MGSYIEPSGSDDTGQIMDALASKSNRGGRILLGEGDFQISEKFDLATSGVSIIGQGGLPPGLSGKTPPTRLQWIGAEDTQAICAAVNVEGWGLEHLCLDGQGKLENGFISYGGVYGRFNAHITGAKQWGLLVFASESSNSMHNEFKGSVYNCGQGIQLDGNGERNACLNDFWMDVQRVGKAGAEDFAWRLGDCDSNRFWGCQSPGYLVEQVPGVKYGWYISDPNKARTNYFYHLLPGSRRGGPGPQFNDGKAFFIANARAKDLTTPYWRSRIYGIDRTNGEGFFETDTGEPWKPFVALFD